MKIRAEKWVNDGLCIGYENGEAVFIAGALPGELVECEPIKKNKVRVTKVIEASPLRIESDCSIFLNCGGCSYRHLSYENELELKKELLQKELAYRTPDIRYPPTKIHSASPLGYRNNAQIKILGNKKGFFEAGTNELVSIPASGCKNLPEEINSAVRKANSNHKELKLRLTDQIIEYGNRESIFKINGKTIKVPVNGFFQINRFLIEPWLNEIESLLPPQSESLLELFSGSGLISLNITNKTDKLYGFEVENSSVQYAVRNAKENHLDNLQFKALNLFKDDLPEEVLASKTWVMNPPRAGLGNKIIETIIKNKPETILYSSCNYIQLAADLKKITSNSKYKATHLSLFDFFPRTPYFETLVKLE